MTYQQPIDAENAKQPSVVTKRCDQLYQVAEDATARALRYLFFVNSGGAIAVLSFLGTKTEEREMLKPRIALGLFVLGLVLVGVLNTVIFHRSLSILSRWRCDVESHIRGELSWQDLLQRDHKRSVLILIEYIIAYGSFFCFIAACVLGAVALFVAP